MMKHNSSWPAKLLRGRSLFYLIALFFAAYIGINYLIFNTTDSRDDAKRKLNNNVNHQLNALKERIKELQKSIDKSKSEAEELRSRIQKASFEIYDGEKATKLMKELDAKKTKPSDGYSNAIAVLVIACRRPQAVDNHLKQLIEMRAKSGKQDKFPIIVSQDCNHEETAQTIEKYTNELYAFIKQPDQSEITQNADGTGIPTHLQGYYKISRHYKWAMGQVFERFKFQSAIITEEDLNIAVDFFDYFEAMHPVLAKNSDSLFCVSAWNDNGKRNVISLDKADMVHRSDFFPGLGWMMLREFWVEIKDKWPSSYWDDWLREEKQRKKRGCLRPEVSRTEISGAFGKFGVSL